MRKFTIREMRNTLGRLDAILAEEGEILLVRHGKPVARVMPVSVPDRPSHALLREEVRRLGRAGRTAAEDVRCDRESR